MRRCGWWIAVALVGAACGDDDPGTMPIDNSGGDNPSGPTDPGTPGGGGGGGTTEPDPVVRSFEVPADESQPMAGSNSVSLSYIEFPASDQDSDEYLVVHFGGPGSSAVSTAPNFLEFFPREVRERYTILGIDEIGVANSEPFECETPGLDASTTPELNSAAEDALLDALADDFEDCQRGEPLVLEASTERYARDIERLRVELGIPSLSFLGFSYGTQVAMTYAALFPEQTDRIALDSVVDPRIAFSTQSVDQVEARVDAYEAFFEWCDNQAAAGCSITQEGLNTLAAQVATLGTQAEFDGFNFLVSSLNTEPVWESLGIIFSNVGSDFSVFADFAGAGGLGSFNFLAFIATSCMESPPATLDNLRDDRSAFVAGYSSDLNAELFFEPQFVVSYLCLAWEPRDVSIDWEASFAMIDDEIDVLIVGATGDTQTPVQWTESVAASLPDATRITIPEVSHAVGFQGVNDCVDSAISDFLLGENVPDDECAKSVIPEGDDDALSVFPQLPRPSWL